MLANSYHSLPIVWLATKLEGAYHFVYITKVGLVNILRFFYVPMEEQAIILFTMGILHIRPQYANL